MILAIQNQMMIQSLHMDDVMKPFEGAIQSLWVHIYNGQSIHYGYI